VEKQTSLKLEPGAFSNPTPMEQWPQEFPINWKSILDNSDQIMISIWFSKIFPVVIWQTLNRIIGEAPRIAFKSSCQRTTSPLGLPYFLRTPEIVRIHRP
jgi:hypothetical protein